MKIEIRKADRTIRFFLPLFWIGTFLSRRLAENARRQTIGIAAPQDTAKEALAPPDKTSDVSPAPDRTENELAPQDTENAAIAARNAEEEGVIPSAKAPAVSPREQRGALREALRFLRRYARKNRGFCLLQVEEKDGTSVRITL